MKDDNSSQLRQLIREELSSIKDSIEVIKEKLDSHTGTLMDIESRLDSYRDSYKENKKNIKRLDSRLTVVEDVLTIEVAEDLKVPHFTEE